MVNVSGRSTESLYACGSVDTHVLCIYMYIQREVTHVE